MATKRCSRCREVKDRNEFYSDKSHKDKLDNNCKECKKEVAKRDYENNPEKLKARVKKWQKNNPEKCRKSQKNWEEKNRAEHTEEYYKNLSGTKMCSKCKGIKDIKEFFKDRTKKDGLCDWCKECCNKQNRKYRENNLEYYKEYQREWVKNNPNYHKEYIKKWRENHSKKIKET